MRESIREWGNLGQAVWTRTVYVLVHRSQWSTCSMCRRSGIPWVNVARRRKAKDGQWEETPPPMAQLVLDLPMTEVRTDDKEILGVSQIRRQDLAIGCFLFRVNGPNQDGYNLNVLTLENLPDIR